MTKHEFRRLVEEILVVSGGSLSDSDSRQTVPGWSSLADVQIFSVIENDLGISADDELFEAQTLGDLLQAIERRHGFSEF